MNNGDYKNKKTFNNQKGNGNYNKPQSNNNFIGNNKKKNFNQESRDDIYSPKVYPKKQKISQFDAILNSLEMPEYMSMKSEANAKRQRDLKYKRDRRK